MDNNSFKFIRKSTFSPRVTINSNKKKNIRNVFFPFMKNNEKTNSKKVVDFPLHLTLFVKNKENSENKTAKKAQNTKFNFKLSSFKPKDLNIKKLKLDKIMKKNEKSLISRNFDVSSNSIKNNNDVLNIDSFNTSKIFNINKLLESIKSPRIRLKSINYTPLNINTKNSPIIINQIGIDNSSTSKLSTKMNNLSNNSIENDISLIKSMKNTSYKKFSKNNLSFNEKKIPSIFPKPKRKNFFNRNNIVKTQLKEIKKLLQKEVNSFDADKKNDIYDLKINTNINKEKDISENHNNINNNNNIANKNSNNNSDTKKLNFNFKLAKDKTNNRHNSFNVINLKNSLSPINKIENNNAPEINEGINKLKKNSSIIRNDKKKLSLDISKIIENKNENNKEKTSIKRKKSGKNFLRSRSKKIQSHKKISVKVSNNNFYSLQFQNTNKNKFLEKFNNYQYIYEKQNKQISNEKSTLLLNMQIKTNNYTHSIKRKNLIEVADELFKRNEFRKVKEIYYQQIIKENNQRTIKEMTIQKEKFIINKNCNLSIIISNYLLASYEFEGLSSSNGLNLNRRNAKQFEFTNISENSDYGIIFQERFLKKEEESFKRTKSNVFRFNYLSNDNNNWMHTSNNIIRIQEITQKANNFDNLLNIHKNNNKVYFRKSSTINEFKDISNKLSKKNILSNLSPSRTNSMNVSPSRKKKSLRLTYKNRESNKNFSILEMKKFFTRNKRGRNANKEEIDIIKEENIFSSLSENSLRMLSSYNVTSYKLEEYYYVLLNCILKGLNKNFINFFPKMKKKMDINQQIYNGNTLLIFSAKEGNFAITKFLCQQGADVNLQNDAGNTALHYAIANQFFSIVDILKDNGAKEDILNNKGKSPWDCIESGLN